MGTDHLEKAKGERSRDAVGALDLLREVIA